MKMDVDSREELTPVSTIPGRSATEVMVGSSSPKVLARGQPRFRQAQTPETYRHKLFIAALLALYGPQPGVPLIAAPELTKTIRPPRSLLRNAGRAALTAVIREKKLTSK